MKNKKKACLSVMYQYYLHWNKEKKKQHSKPQITSWTEQNKEMVPANKKVIFKFPLY